MSSAVTPAPDRPHRRVEHRREQVCRQCNRTFTPRRSDPRCRWCSHRCRTAHWRGIRWTWALITWGGNRRKRQHHYDASFLYCPSRAAAYTAAPPDAPFTVIDLAAIPHTPHPPNPEFLHTRLLPGTDPYPAHRPTRGDARPSSVNPL